MDNVIEMETRISSKLWNRDFTLLMGGKVVSIFGNTILSFVLPLYILYISGSAALFGLVLGLTNIPMLLMAPIGGLIADRLYDEGGNVYDIIAGTFFVCGLDNEEGSFTSLAPEHMAKFKSAFRQPEAFARIGGKIIAIKMDEEIQEKTPPPTQSDRDER